MNGTPLPNYATTTTAPTPPTAPKEVSSNEPALKRDPATEQATRQMIRDLVSTMDPEVKIEREVEDVSRSIHLQRSMCIRFLLNHSCFVPQMLFDIASEFVESVTNFSCRLARHRGSDTLDVKDLQLHLGKIPIPIAPVGCY